MRDFFEAHKTEEWLQERYSPAIRHRLQLQKNIKKMADAKAFFQRLPSMHMCLDEASMKETTLYPMERDQSLSFSRNDMEASNRILYIRRVPCLCPTAALSQAVIRVRHCETPHSI